MRKLALVCSSPPFDGNEMPLPMPSYGIHRVHAAAKSGQYPHDTEVRFFDIGLTGAEAGLKAILDFGPDLVGFSVYVWSMTALLQLAADIRALGRHAEALDDLPPDTLMDPTSIAETYWQLHRQKRSAWTFEMDLRPWKESW